ncbi:MAG: hypothetical protein GY859_38015 [Desulfobacterales bacterium]|nr:hypothetical protein [Desulfobacterales bacterium]
MQDIIRPDSFLKREVYIRKRKPGLSLDQHRTLGFELYDMSECLAETVRLLSEVYRVKTGVTKKTHKIMLMVDELRADMNALSKREKHPEKIEDIEKVYYPRVRRRPDE